MEIIQGEIIVRYMAEQKKEILWELKQPIIIGLSNGAIIEIPVGFITDFASVPKILWSAISSIGKFNLASVVHDYFYSTHIYSRCFSDKEFLRLMHMTSPNTKLRNRIMFYAVRLFGNKRWKEQGL
jgi:Protein of unknown function (DUF1353)